MRVFSAVKTPPFLLIGCPVIIVVACIVYGLTYPSLHRTAFHAALIDAEKPAAETDSDSEEPTARQLRIQRAFAELGLTDSQKQQIAQIRQTILDRQQRHEAIMNVLSPEQRAKWLEIRNSNRAGSGSGSP
jgi:Spy/CpxP family protein refolding chaperone